MVTFVYNNSDHNLESIRGVTMHATKGIITQRAIHTSNEPQQSSSASTTKRLKNSFKLIYNELAPYLKSKTKTNPQNTNNLISNIAKNQDTVWYLTGYKKGESTTQKVPSWRGFYHLVFPGSQSKKLTVSYLPSVNDSPTKYEVVYEIFLQCKEKLKHLV